MKKLLGIVVLSLLLTGNAYAKLEVINKSDEGSIYYIDTSTLKIVGDTRYFLMITDYAKPLTESGNLSSKSYIEINCKNLNMYKVFSVKFYNLPLGEGPVDGEKTHENPQWSFVKKNTNGYAVNISVCKIPK